MRATALRMGTFSSHRRRHGKTAVVFFKRPPIAAHRAAAYTMVIGRPPGVALPHAKRVLPEAPHAGGRRPKAPDLSRAGRGPCARDCAALQPGFTSFLSILCFAGLGTSATRSHAQIFSFHPILAACLSFPVPCRREINMWLLAFSVLALIVGNDLRRRGFSTRLGREYAARASQTAEDAIAVGAWINLLGAICLNIAVWNLF